MKSVYSIFIICIFHQSLILGQCFEPDESVWKDTWASCKVSDNPNPAYAESHWILYNLGIVRHLSKTWVWNTNEPGKLDQGFNEVNIDYSLDGIEWIHWGEMNFPKGEGNAIYSGFEGPDLQNIQAQYVLITSISNHGHAGCAGIAEFKFNLMPNSQMNAPEPEEEEEEEECLSIEEMIIEEVLFTETFIYWEVEEWEEEEEITFIFRYGMEEDALDNKVFLDEPEVFLEDLEPGVEYYFEVALNCGDEEEVSEVYSFTTLACQAVSNIGLEIDEDEVYLYWETSEEQEYFIIQWSIPGSEEIEEDETDEPELFIEDIEEYVGYEFIVGIECGEGIVWSEPFVITLNNSQLPTSTFDLSSMTIMEGVNIEVYPNPTRDNLQLNISSDKLMDVSYSIFDISGRLMIQDSRSIKPGNNYILVDVLDLNDGMYFLSIRGSGTSSTISTKVVKIN